MAIVYDNSACVLFWDWYLAGPYGGPADDRHNPYTTYDDKHRYNRANIDPYATLTPSERLRNQQVDGKCRSPPAIVCGSFILN